MTALLAVPKYGWYLIAGGIFIFGLVAIATTPHRIRCCGLLWTPDQYSDHVKRCHRAE
jgi:hypothetical protein